MNDAPKTPNEYPLTWFLMGGVAAAIVVCWLVTRIISDDPLSSWWLVSAIPFGVLAAVMPRREERQMMEELRRMNRGKMDQPGWTKKPWQHDIGEKK